MAQFVILEPAGLQFPAKAESSPSDRIAPMDKSIQEQADKTVFIKDGLSVLAIVFPVIWLLINRLWFEAFSVLAIIILLGIAGTMLEIPGAVPFLSLLLSFFVALEGPNWKIAKLRRRGYREIATIDARNLDEAEIRFFSLYQPQTENKQAPDWSAEILKANLTQNSMKSPTDQNIGFVGYRGEN